MLTISVFHLFCPFLWFPLLTLLSAKLGRESSTANLIWEYTYNPPFPTYVVRQILVLCLLSLVDLIASPLQWDSKFHLYNLLTFIGQSMSGRRFVWMMFGDTSRRPRSACMSQVQQRTLMGDIVLNCLLFVASFFFGIITRTEWLHLPGLLTLSSSLSLFPLSMCHGFSFLLISPSWALLLFFFYICLDRLAFLSVVSLHPTFSVATF